MSVIGIGCYNECGGMVIVAIVGGGISDGLTFIDVVVQERSIDRRQGMEGQAGNAKKGSELIRKGKQSNS